VWGTDVQNNVFLLDEKTSTFNVEKSAKLKTVTANNEVWGIGLDNIPYKWNGKSFEIVSSSIKSKNIAVTSSGNVYSLSLDGFAHELKDSEWQKIEGRKLKSIMTDNDVLCGISLDSTIWFWKEGKWISEVDGSEAPEEKQTPLKVNSEKTMEKKETTTTLKNTTSVVKPETKKETLKVEPNTVDQKTIARKKGFSLVIQKEQCLSCGKTVYANEKITADGKIYHLKCFRCFSFFILIFQRFSLFL
jgi:predicted Zn-ribbon and HTH transcriptional regulator